MIRARESQQGFALIVVSALFIAFALMAAAFMDRSTATQQLAQMDTTRAQLSRISNAIEQYNIYNGAYPCPADPAIAAGGTNYGVPLASCATATLNGGNTFINGTGIAIIGGSPYEIARGMVPFTALLAYGLDPNDVIDIWNDKIVYIVNRKLTAVGGTATVYPTVTEINTAQIFEPPEFVVMSYGRDGLGAYPKNGTAPTYTCPATSTVNRLENCDWDAGLLIGPPQTNQALGNAVYFDDLLSFHGKACLGGSC